MSVNIARLSSVKRRSTATRAAASAGSVLAATHSSVHATKTGPWNIDHNRSIAASDEEVVAPRAQQLGLRGEVVQLGAARHPGPARGLDRRRRRVAPLDQTLQRGVEQRGPGRDAPLLHPAVLGHPRHAFLVCLEQQSVKPDCFCPRRSRADRSAPRIPSWDITRASERDSCPNWLAGGPLRCDVLVEAEDVVAVPLSFERDETLIAAPAVDLSEVVLTRLAEVVDVVDRRRDLLHAAERFATPVEMGVVIALVMPQRFGHQPPVGAAPAEGGVIVADARDRAAHGDHPETAL